MVVATGGHVHHATRLFRNGVQLLHGFTFNGQELYTIWSHMASAVVGSYSNSCPPGMSNWEQKDSGCYLASCLDQFQQAPCFTFLQRIQKPLIPNEQFVLSVFPHQFTIGPVTTIHCGLYQKIWQANIFCAVIIAVGGNPKGACQIGFACSCGSEDDRIMRLLDVGAGRQAEN